MVEAMKTAREPAVYVDLEAPEFRTLYFTVGNSGQTSAVNIRFVIEQDVKGLRYGQDASGIASIPIIDKGIAYLAPGRLLKWRAGIFNPSEADAADNILQMRVLYENEHGKEFERSIAMDMSLFNAVLFASYRTPSSDIVSAVKEAARSLQTRDHSPQLFALVSKKTCPMCAEEIPAAAKKCSHCGELLAANENPELQ